MFTYEIGGGKDNKGNVLKLGKLQIRSFPPKINVFFFYDKKAKDVFSRRQCRKEMETLATMEGTRATHLALDVDL